MIIRAYIGDITTETLGAIVNAAKESLLGGGGVDGAVHRAAGDGLVEECKELSVIETLDNGAEVRCPTGEARVTGAHDLPCHHVIHAVGPDYRIYGPKLSPKLLYNTYHNSMLRAEELGITSISFPAISTGIYGYPLIEATAIAINAVTENHKTTNIDVNFVCFDYTNLLIYKQMLELIIDDGGIVTRNCFVV